VLVVTWPDASEDTAFLLVTGKNPYKNRLPWFEYLRQRSNHALAIRLDRQLGAGGWICFRSVTDLFHWLFTI